MSVSGEVQRLLRKSEVAALLGVGIRTVERLISAGSLVKVKVRGAVRVPEASVLSFQQRLMPSRAGA